MSKAKLLLAITFLFAARPAWSQSTDLDRLADEIVAQVVRDKGTRLLISGRFKCEKGDCKQVPWIVPARLKAAISARARSFAVLQDDDLTEAFHGTGLLFLDAYKLEFLPMVARYAKADLFLTGSVGISRDTSKLKVQLARTSDSKKLFEKESVLDPGRESDTKKMEPVYDPVSNVYLADVGGIGKPSCEQCTNPEFTKEAIDKRTDGVVLLLVTVTAEGKASGITVVKGLKDGLTERAVESVRGWRFKPALDSQGRPVATRVGIEVGFRQYDSSWPR